jgi:hypothetical protein
MTDPRTALPRTSANATTAQPTQSVEPVDLARDADSGLAAASDSGRAAARDSGRAAASDSPPGTPRWVKAFGIALVVLLLAFAGLHLTGHAPTHMPGASGAQHGMQSP